MSLCSGFWFFFGNNNIPQIPFGACLDETSPNPFLSDAGMSSAVSEGYFLFRSLCRNLKYVARDSIKNFKTVMPLIGSRNKGTQWHCTMHKCFDKGNYAQALTKVSCRNLKIMT
jgi:hypothetical protein